MFEQGMQSLPIQTHDIWASADVLEVSVCVAKQ